MLVYDTSLCRREHLRVEAAFLAVIYNSAHRYRNTELTDIHMMYGTVIRNGLAAQRLCKERFSTRQVSNRKPFKRRFAKWVHYVLADVL